MNDGAPEKGPKQFQIKIDRTMYTVDDDVISEATLRALPDPDVGTDRDIFEVVPGGSDRKIEPGATVQLRNGLRFFTAPAQINPGAK